MRTTLTLDPDVAALLRKRVAKGDVSFKEAVNDAMRKGLTADVIAQKPKNRYSVRPKTPGGGFLVDITDNGALAEMMDREDYPDLYRR
ncbi:MAG: hypothetical protein ACKOEC_20580 [Acidimicrobiia bacterium]